MDRVRHHIGPGPDDYITVDPKENRRFSVSDTARMIAEKARSITPSEFRESLVRAGIIDENGELTPPYRKGE